MTFKTNSSQTKSYNTFEDSISSSSANHRLGASAELNTTIMHNKNNSKNSKEKTSCAHTCCNNLKENVLLILLILSICIGIGLGVILRTHVTSSEKATISYIKFPGELLMRMLKLLILPLIVSSLIAGLASLDASASGKLGMRAVIYYLSTTVLAVLLGVLLVQTIQPGKDKNSQTIPEAEETKASKEKATTADAFLDLFRNMFPDNIILATLQSAKTTLKSVPSNSSTSINGTILQPVLSMVDGSNVLGIVIYSVVLGIVIARMGESGKPVAKFMDCLQEATMKMVNIVIWYSPVGIMFLIAAEIIAMEDPIKSLQQLGLYMVTVLSGLGIHGFIVLPLIYFICTRKNPLIFMRGVLPAMATAFGTSSSGATLPVTYHCLEENLKVDRRVTRFMLPVGATINMDGTALYEAVAPMFIAQLGGYQLGFGEIVAITITATCASIGAASVPQAGLVTMVIVLTAAGLPTDDIAKILAVDWFLDRFRTMVNVLGDAFGSGIVEHLSQKELAASDEQGHEKLIDKREQITEL